MTKEERMRSLEGRVALITGASRGIGRAMALAFGQAGALVAVTARTPPALEAVVSAVRDSGSAALAIPADLSLEADIQRIADTALSHFGRLDILVNNAGIVHPRVDLVDFDPPSGDR
jgi:NAD(P)-dependent dehydrogenase (short-subunit alcohol dehydrogenase family)